MDSYDQAVPVRLGSGSAWNLLVAKMISAIIVRLLAGNFLAQDHTPVRYGSFENIDQEKLCMARGPYPRRNNLQPGIARFE